eukprot:scaffold22011_cov132-Skeletonema_menzelii.AAC.3
MKGNGGATEGNDDDLSAMSVNELRRKLSELGLDVDGSREAMIEALQVHVNESTYADQDDDSDSHDDENDDVDLLED